MIYFLSTDEIQEVIDNLVGTTGELSEALGEYTHMGEEDEPAQASLEAIDEEIFQCEQCSWWMYVGEMSEDSQVCIECFEENENEDV